MKKFYVFAAVAIAALASCTKSEVVYNQGQQEIGFRQFTGSMTKANTNLSELAGVPTMGVFAHIWNSANEEKVYFSNAKFVKPESGNSWGGDPKRYWPLKDELDFTVYAPWVEGTTYTHTSSELAVTVADNTTNQYDFLYGKERYIQETKTSSAVPVVLKHALSKLTFKVKSNVSGQFKITKVELVEALQSGSFKVKYDPFSITMFPGGTKTTCNVYAAEAGSSLSVTDSYQDLGSKLVFPIGGPQNEAKLRITYNMVEATGLVAEVALNHDWDSGKHYTYNVDINATEILLTPTVEEWATGTTSPITIN